MAKKKTTRSARARRAQNQPSPSAYKTSGRILFVLGILFILIGLEAITSSPTASTLMILIGVWSIYTGQKWKKLAASQKRGSAKDKKSVSKPTPEPPKEAMPKSEPDLGTAPAPEPEPEQPLEQEPEKEPEPEFDIEEIKAAGVKYYIESVLELAQEYNCYDMTKRDFIDMFMIDERVYEYAFFPEKAELIPEPQNQYDSNAIKIVVDGEHVGYVKKGRCAHVHKLIREERIDHIKTVIGGGKFKIVKSDYDFEKGKETYVLEKGETPYFVHLYLYLKK